MQMMETDAVLAQPINQPIDPNMYMPQAYQDPNQGQNDLFTRENALQVIQEYNREETLPSDAKNSFWSLASKSIKLGFWKEDDARDIFLHKNIIKVGHLMANPRFKYTFEERQMMNHMDMLVYADFKRGVGMERYKINERTLQATSVTQSIQGSTTGGQRKGGVVSGLKAFFG